MKATETVIGEKICRIYADDTPEYIIIQPTGEHELERLDEETRKKAIIPITRKGRTSKYSGREVNNIELRTLHDTIFLWIQDTFNLKGTGNQYTCPESELNVLIQLCEDGYNYGLHKKRGSYLDAFKDAEYVDKTVRLYIYFL